MRNKFRIALLSMAAVGLVGCADKLSDDITPSQEGVTDGCVTFKINNVGNQTRATTEGGFTEGEGNEYAITRDAGANMVFIFDENGYYVSKSDLQVVSDPAAVGSDDHVGENQDHENRAREMYFNARIRKTKSEDEKKLKCIMILNATPSRLSALSEALSKGTTTIDEFMRATDKLVPGYNLGQYKKNDTDIYFTMSNTVYVDDDSNGGKEIKGPITISDENIFPTAQEAAEHPVTVHVERLSAKFSLAVDQDLKMGSDGIISMGDDELYIMLPSTETEDNGKLVPTKKQWGIKIVGWNVNGTETATFWVKNLKTSDDEPVYNEDTGYNIGNWEFDFNDASKWGWNDPSRIRSYWAVDPHYNDNENDRYPEQYRDAKNTENGETIVNGTNGYEYTFNALYYISYNAIGNDLISIDRYAPENTFGGYEFMTRTVQGDRQGYIYKGDGYKRASTHILVAAELMFKNASGNLETFDGYCYENVYWKEDNNENKDLISHMAYQVIQEYGKEVFVDVDGAKKRIDDGVDYNDYFKFKTNTTPSVESNGATIKGGDGRVMLQLKEGVHLFLKKTDGSGDYEEISGDELNKNFQKAIYTAGTAKHYNQGKMYYAIPIEHMAKMYKEKDEDKEDYGELYYNTGSFGVVRNHWYKINIKDIKVTGIPVDDPDQPIIPSDDPDEGGYIAFEIVIVPWHVINQDVEFK